MYICTSIPTTPVLGLRLHFKCTILITLGSAFLIRISLFNINGEFVLLITSHVSIAHKIQHVGIASWIRRHKVQFDLGLLLECQTLD